MLDIFPKTVSSRNATKQCKRIIETSVYLRNIFWGQLIKQNMHAAQFYDLRLRLLIKELILKCGRLLFNHSYLHDLKSLNPFLNSRFGTPRQRILLVKYLPVKRFQSLIKQTIEKNPQVFISKMTPENVGFTYKNLCLFSFVFCLVTTILF